MNGQSNGGGGSPPAGVSTTFQLYALALLVAANILNYADRSILSVLADEIKRDLELSDAQIGFLYGTNFAVLNAVMCIAMGRLTDNWMRNWLWGTGLAVWSGFTALSGFAQNYIQLNLARAGVGIGESTMSPVSHSLIAEIFSEQRRSISFAIYQVGPFIGPALCLAGGGWIVGAWPDHCGTVGLCQIKGWQAAFLAFGIPGILLAVFAMLLRDPASGADLRRRQASSPVREGMRELSTLLPPFTVVQITRLCGRRAVIINLAVAAGLIAAVSALIFLTGDRAQWIGMAIAIYAVTSWAQVLMCEDESISRLTVRSPVFLAATGATALFGTIMVSINFWTVPLAFRMLELSPHQAGAALGQAIGLGGFIGTITGGLANDWWRKRDPAAGLWITLIALVTAAIMLFVTLQMKTLTSYAIALGVTTALTYTWQPGMASLTQTLVHPNMRGRATSFFVITVLVISMCLGPYAVGRIADSTGSLVIGLGLMFLVAPFAAGMLIFAGRGLPRALALRDHTPTGSSE